MRILGLTLLVLALQLVAFGQLEENTLTVVSSQPLSVQADQLVFSVTVEVESTAGLPDVLAAVQSVGITAANLSSVSTYGQPAMTQWSFTLPVPFSKQADTLSALLALQQTVQKAANRYVNYSIQGARVSPQLQASATCPYGALFQDAMEQARTIAGAAGVMLGSVITVSDGTSVDVSLPSPAPVATIVVTEIFDPLTSVSGFVGFPQPTPIIRGLSGLAGSAPSPQPICAMTVQFRLLH